MFDVENNGFSDTGFSRKIGLGQVARFSVFANQLRKFIVHRIKV